MAIETLFETTKCRKCGVLIAWHAQEKDYCLACVPSSGQGEEAPDPLPPLVPAEEAASQVEPDSEEAASLIESDNEEAISPSEGGRGEETPPSEGERDLDFIDLAGILESLQIQEVQASARPVFSAVLLPPRKAPLRGLLFSVIGHVVVITLLVGLSSLWGTSTFDMTREMLEQNYTLTYYRPSDLLPLMSSPKPGPKDPAGEKPHLKASKGSTSYHPSQTTQSSPLKHDNASQTIVQPKNPEVTIKKEVKLPNIVVWNVEEAKTDNIKLAQKTATPLSSTAMPAPQLKVVESDMKNVDRSLSDLNLHTELINSQPKMPVNPGASPEWAIGNETGRSEELIRVPGAQGDASLHNMVVLSANPGLPGPGSLKVPSGNRSGAFSISPDGNRVGSPDGSDDGLPGGGVAGGGGTGGNGSGAGGGRGAAQIQIPGLSVKGGGASVGSSGVVGSGRKPNFSEMVTIEEPAESYNVTIVEGRSGGAGLGVFGVLTGKRNYTVFIPMPGGRWIMQFSEIPDASDASPAPAKTARPSGGTVSVGMGETMTQPRPYRKVDPGRPEDEELAKLRGLTVLFAVVRKDGTVEKVRVVRSLNPALDERAMEALKKWKFKPAQLGNETIEVQALFGIPFKPPLTRP